MKVSDEVAIQITRMNKWFGAFHVLRDIDMTVYRASGSWSAGLGFGQVDADPLHQPAGGASVGPDRRGRDRADEDLKNIDKVRSEVGMVFQHFNLFPHLTILENCTLAPIWVRKIPKREAEEIAMHFLEKVKIPEQALKYPGQLSGGQQQRVAIARSLCMKPADHAVRRADLGARPRDDQGGARHDDRSWPRRG
jgi:general L-amino acid transport system ATP-binding protein